VFFHWEGLEMIDGRQRLSGVWSAAPTPLRGSWEVDVESVGRMLDHHYRLGVRGLLLAGTCGEGPFLPVREVRRLTRSAAEANEGRLRLAVQVTDNSYVRVLEKVREAAADGAEIAVISEPWFMFPRATEFMKEKYYFEVLERSVLPVGLYCREMILSVEAYRRLLLHPNLCMAKDSTMNVDFMSICAEILSERRDFALLMQYLKAGYTGALCGGAVLVGQLLGGILAAAGRGDYGEVSRLQEQSNRILYTVYGGKDFSSWIPGLKYMLCQMGIFREGVCVAEYPLPGRVKGEIERLWLAEREVLRPYAEGRGPLVASESPVG